MDAQRLLQLLPRIEKDRCHIRHNGERLKLTDRRLRAIGLPVASGPAGAASGPAGAASGPVGAAVQAEALGPAGAAGAAV